MFAIRKKSTGSSNSYSNTLQKGLIMAAYFGGIRLAYWLVNCTTLFQETPQLPTSYSAYY